MPDFMDEAKKLASEHSDVADQGLDQAAEQAKEKTGGRFDSQIEGGEEVKYYAKNLLARVQGKRVIS